MVASPPTSTNEQCLRPVTTRLGNSQQDQNAPREATSLALICLLLRLDLIIISDLLPFVL